MDTCLFCKISENIIPSNKIYEDNKYLAFLDISPLNEGHSLVIAKEHQEHIEDYSEETCSGLLKVAHKIIRKMKKSNIKYDACNILMNNGIASGQEVPHAHLHIIPRHKSDNIIKKFETKNINNYQKIDLKKTKLELELNQ